MVLLIHTLISLDVNITCMDMTIEPALCDRVLTGNRDDEIDTFGYLHVIYAIFIRWY